MKDFLGTIFAVAWFGSGVYGIFLIISKGYLSSVLRTVMRGSSVSCLLVLFLGIFIIPIITMFVTVTCPIWLIVGLKLTPKRPCPYCKNQIFANATRCQHCQAQLPAAVQSELST
jgi:hypothetical protein